MVDKGQNAPEDPSLDVHRARLSAALMTYEASLKAWRARRKIYSDMLELWDEYGQLKMNPVDKMRMEFIDAEISKQQEKYYQCSTSSAKFEELARKMRDLVTSVPQPTAEEHNLAEDEALMEIREELDDDGNIVSATVEPHKMEVYNSLAVSLGIKPETETPLPPEEPAHEHSMTQTRKTVCVSTPSKEIPSCSSSPSPVPFSEEPTQKYRNECVPSKHSTTTCNNNPQALEELTEHENTEILPQSYNVERNANGAMELVNDPNGYSIGVLPQDMAEMASIVDEMDWEKEDDSDDDASEDEFGRTKHTGTIPLPGTLSRSKHPQASKHPQEIRPDVVENNRRITSAYESNTTDSAREKKKKIVFAESLVQGPTQVTGTPAKSVLKKSTAYPIEDTPAIDTSTPVVSEPVKLSRFKLQRSSSDTHNRTIPHARPSQAFQQKLAYPVRENIVEKEPVIEPKAEPPLLTTEEHERLFPKKINLATQDLAPEEGTFKRPMIVRKMTDDELAAIKKKREALGKKNHRRRKSVDPQYPVRSSSWDESQPMQKEGRSLSSGADEIEKPELATKAAALARARDLINAQSDIVWANEPITPEISPGETVTKNPLSSAGKQLQLIDQNLGHIDTNGTAQESTAKIVEPKSSQKIVSLIPGTISPESKPGSTGIASPRPRKPPTPERRGSWNTNIPSPLSQEIVSSGPLKEVQFSSEVIQKLEPLSENPEEPSVIVNERRQRKMPPKEPTRRPSIDPMAITPTRGSPPPEGRLSGPLETEEKGAIKHTMVRSTPKSPPPHIAIHDLNTASSTSAYFTEHDEVLPERASSEDHQDVSKDTNEPTPVMSRDIKERELASASSEDEIDDELHRKEIQSEYHRLRSRMIAREGGFAMKPEEEESELQPLDEDNPGPGQRISRFKAARLGNM